MNVVKPATTAADPSYFEANVAALVNRWGRPFQDLPERSDRIRVEMADGLPRLALRTRNDRWVSIHSRRPVEEAHRWLDDAIDGPEPACVVVIGLGLGYILDALEQRAPGAHVIAVEPDPAFLRPWLDRRDWRDWIDHGRLTLLVGPEYHGLSDAARRVVPSTDAPPVIVHPTIARESPEAAVEAGRMAARVVGAAAANAEARRQFAGPYLLNTLRNLPRIALDGDVSCLTGVFRGIGCMLVGAGPSLDGLLPQIRELRAYALVIASDTAVAPLLEAGVQPHLVVAVDP